MRVFVSSTCYDLIDIRADIAEDLRQLGVSVLLSDDKLSDFDVLPNLNSIESCLANVRSCDEFLIVLDRRYGPSLSGTGYDDISATHLEYRTAVDLNIPVRMYVRDRLDAEARIWRTNKKNPPLLNWVDQKDWKIFDVLTEHTKLTKEASSNNWRHIFTNSVDLRHSLRRVYGARVTEATILDSLSRNQFPIVHLSTENNFNYPTQEVIIFSNTLQNIGGAPAFCLKAKYGDTPNVGTEIDMREEPDQLLAPGQTLAVNTVYRRNPGINHATFQLNISYLASLGVRIQETWEITFKIIHFDQLGAVSGAALMARTFHRQEAKLIRLEDD